MQTYINEKNPGIRTEDGGINIEYVGITFSAMPQYQKEIENALFENLGIIPHIRVELLSE